jgi:hypothetical protein
VAETRRTGLLVAGGVVLVVLLATALVLWLSADRRHDDNVASLARAPSGCDTTLDFERTGSFTLYVETVGELGDLRGDCDADVRYARDDEPDVELVFRDPDGGDVVVTSVSEPHYDTGTYVGRAVGTVEIEQAGDHVLTVAGDGEEAFAVAVGGDPDDGVALLRWGGVAAAMVGLVAGGALLVLGSRRPPVTTPEVDEWAPGGQDWPAAPPGLAPPPPTTGATAPPGGSEPSSTPTSGPFGPPTTPGVGGPPSGPPLVEPGERPTSPWAPPGG